MDDEAIGRALDALDTAGDAHTRAVRLAYAADLLHAASRLPGEYAGPDRDAAVLLGLLADVEFVVAGRVPFRTVTGTRFEAVAGPVLDRMCAVAAVEDRARLLAEVAGAVGGLVTAETRQLLARLPYAPGYLGWRPRRWWHGRRRPR